MECVKLYWYKAPEDRSREIVDVLDLSEMRIALSNFYTNPVSIRIFIRNRFQVPLVLKFLEDYRGSVDIVAFFEDVSFPLLSRCQCRREVVKPPLFKIKSEFDDVASGEEEEALLREILLSGKMRLFPLYCKIGERVRGFISVFRG